MAFSTIQGSGGAPDSFVGTSGVDTISLVNSTGNFIVTADGANDVVTFVASFNNPGVITAASVKGGQGDDTVLGGGLLFNGFFVNGNVNTDTLLFTGAQLNGSTIQGGQGTDTINTGVLISSLVNGNKDADTITVDGAGFGSSVFGGQGNDTINVNSTLQSSVIAGDNDNDVITLAAISVALSTVNGGDGTDTINGALATSAIFADGGAGNDQVVGSANGDTLLGGDGNDTITGNAGADSVTGGAGQDAFRTGVAGGVAATAAVATVSMTFANGVDIITDFATNETLASGNAAFVIAADAVRGNFSQATGVFTASATGSDTLVATGLVADFLAGTAVVTTDNATVLLGTGGALIAANLI